MIHPIPSGTRDVLPDETREVRAITDTLRGVFERHGYGEVYTPALEYESVLARADMAEARPAYRVFDESGAVLVLRSDMTVPIARVIATRYASSEPPLRFCYFAHCYRGVRPQRGRADQLDPCLQQLARLPALGAHAAVAVDEVAEAQGRLAGCIAGGDHARDRHGHVRAQHQHGAGLVEDAVGGPGFGHVRAREHRLVLQRRRVDLAVAVALEDPPQGVGDGAHLARLVWQHVARAAGNRVDHEDPRRLRVNGLYGHALDACAEIAQALVDALVATVDLADVADLAATLRAQGREQHGHAGADVGRLHALATQAPRARDDRPMRVAHDDVRAHQDQLVREDQAVLEHPCL